MRPARRAPQERAVAVHLLALLEEGVVVEVEVARLQVGVAGAGLGRNQLRVGDREHQAIDIGQLAAALVDAVEVGIAHGDEAVGRRTRGVGPGLQRRQVGIVALVEVVQAVVHRRPAPLRRALLLFALHLGGVFLVELPEVVRRPEDEQRRGARHARQEMRVGLRPAVAHQGLAQDLELRRLAVDQEVARRTRGAELLVVGDVLPVVAEVFRGERMAVGPAVALAQLHREDAPLLHVHRLEQIRHDVQVPVVADKARIAVDGEQARVAAAPGERVERAAIVSDAGTAFAERHDQRLLRQALVDRRQLARLHLVDQHRRLDVRPRRAGEQENESQQPHARARTR